MSAVEGLVPVDMELIDRFTENLPHAVGLRPLASSQDEIAASRIEERSMLSMVAARRVVVAWNQTSADLRQVAKILAPPPAESSDLLELRLALIGAARDTAAALRAGAQAPAVAMVFEALARDLERGL